MKVFLIYKIVCYHFKTEIDKITEKKLLKLKGKAKHDILKFLIKVIMFHYVSKYIEAKFDYKLYSI